ncbi:MAG: rod shape-determining protein MreD [Acetobacteraceae bacterium]|nr:rod shape-determining protein MreD [Acetobacteraceae bacterium]
MDDIDRTPGIRPRLTLAGRLDGIARASFPAVSTVLLMLLAAAPFGLPMQAVLLPGFTFSSIWFWSLFRPRSLPPPIVFLIGVFFDLLAYAPLGVGVLTLLIIYAIGLRLGPMLVAQRFSVIWLAFVVVAAAAVLFGWAAGSVLQYRVLPLAPAFFEFSVTVAIFPALRALFARAQGPAYQGRM